MIDTLGGSCVSKNWAVNLPIFFIKKFGNVKTISYLCNLINDKAMRINVNTTLFTLDTVYSTFSHGKIWFMVNILTEVRLELEEEIDRILLTYEMDNERIAQLVEDIETQLDYINKNIRTFEDALLCHETKIFESRTLFGKLTKICLN